MRDWLETIRFFLLRHLIRLHWWCEDWLENCPYPKQHGHYFFEPVSGTAILISLAISAASFGAQLIVTRLLAPKPKQQIKGKLTGDITLTDSIHGAPISRFYGGRPADGSPGGIEAGCNFVWMSDIRKTETQSPSGTGGGKGGPKPPPNIQINYKVDIAGIVGMGRLRLLRMKWNEDTVYSIVGGVGGTPVVTRVEAEAGANTLAGGAVVTADAACSGGNKVTGIGNGGTLTFNITNNFNLFEVLPDDPPVRTPYFHFAVSYKSTGETFAYVAMDGDGGLYSFPDTGGAVGVKEIVRAAVTTNYTLGFSNPTASGPQIDCIDISLEYVVEPGPTGYRNETFPAEPAQDNILLPAVYATDTQAFERYDAPTPPVVDSMVEIPIVGGASLAWYEGTATQPVDPVIDANITALYGAGSTPAFRDAAYFRIQNLDFTEYGSIPAIRVVVENVDLKTVSEILLSEAANIGLEAGDFELSAADAKHCRGFYIQDADAPAKAFEELGLIHNLTFAENHDGKIVAIDLSDRTVVATITAADLGAYVAGESDEVPLDDVVSTVPEESEDLIRILELQFNNPLQPSDFSSDRRSFNFPFTASQKKETKNYSGTLLPEEAGAIIKRELQKHHLQQTPDTIVTTHKFAWVNAGECVEVEIEGEDHVRRIQEKTGSTPGVYEMALLDEEIYILADDGDIIEEFTQDDNKKTVQSSTKYPANTIGTLIDIPPLLDEHKGLTGVYAAACSRGQGQWKGCQVLREKAGEYTPMAALTKQASMGVTVNVLTDVPEEHPEGTEDATATVTVDFYNDYTPSTVTTESAEDGANPFLIGLEVCVVKTWTRDNGFPNRWVGTGIYRLVAPTKELAGSHEIGERVVLLDDAVKFIPLDIDEIGTQRNWKFVTYGGHVEDAAEIAVTWAGENDNNIETSIPVIGQVFAAEQLLIRIGVRGHTETAAFRKVEVSANADMSAAEEVIVTAAEYPDSYLPPEFILTRPSGTTHVTKYVRVSHSSTGRRYGDASNILTVTFATDTGTGGSTGTFSPVKDYKIEVS